VVVDVLRRVGVDVVLASINGAGEVKCSREVRLVPDADLNDVHDLVCLAF
jgi:protein DJ-1